MYKPTSKKSGGENGKKKKKMEISENAHSADHEYIRMSHLKTASLSLPIKTAIVTVIVPNTNTNNQHQHRHLFLPYHRFRSDFGFQNGMNQKSFIKKNMNENK